MNKYWYGHISSSTSFKDWWQVWKNFSTAVGTGIVAFNKVEIQDTFVGTGIATFKSNVYKENAKQYIEKYELDLDNPPFIINSFNRTAANFVSNADMKISFKFPINNFHKITDDRNIKLIYSMSSSNGSSIVVFDAFYFVGTEDSVLSSTATGTASSTFLVGTAANTLYSNSSLTIPNTAISADTDWILVKLMRNGSNVIDNANDFYLYDIEII